MNIHDLFEDKTEIYAQARPRYPTALYEWLADVCPAREAAWDVGCGNGQAAVDLRKYFNRVEATDVSPSQIANAIATEGVSYSVQPAESTSFSSQSFDLVCVAQALHWFDHSQFWPEVKRVLKPGGIFAAWGYTWPHLNEVLDELLDRSLLSVIRPYWAAQNQLLWDRYVDVPMPFRCVEVPAIELSMKWSTQQLFAYFHSWSATRRCMEANGDAFFLSSFEEVSSAWGENPKRPVSMEFVVIAGQNGA